MALSASSLFGISTKPKPHNIALALDAGPPIRDPWSPVAHERCPCPSDLYSS